MRRIQQLLFHNWRAKLASLVLAAMLWLVIKHGIAYTPALQSTMPPATPPNLSSAPRA